MSKCSKRSNKSTAISNLRTQIFNQMHNEMEKLSNKSKDRDNKFKYSCDSDKEILKSLIQFYDSIPEYDEINHLSNKDFYRKLENLKEKQKSFCSYIERERQFKNKKTNWIEDYKNLTIGDKKIQNDNQIIYKPALKQRSNASSVNKSLKSKFKERYELDSISSSDKDLLKPLSTRSVRIETPSDNIDNTELNNMNKRSKTNFSSGDSRNFDKSSPSYIESGWDDLSINELPFDSDQDFPLVTRSASNSPLKQKPEIGWKENGITIPKPFQMTVRDEENKIVEEVLLNVKKPREDKTEMFKAHSIPIESRIPLFNQIVADQERRKEEEMQVLTNRLSKSFPCIFMDDIPIKPKRFKAKPVPRGLFSNYVYQKMHEDEFFRALQRKIRAEEMLHTASLPPSMAKREKIKPKPIICPRSFKSLDDESDFNYPVKSHSIPNYKASHEKLEQELKDLKGDFITTSPLPFKLKTARRSAERRLKRCYGSSRTSQSSRNAENYRAASAADLLSVNKSNLAAVLRIHSAKKKMQMDMCKKLEEAKIREETRWREKVLRKKPAWQALAYSQEEDLAMRLQLRRDEERLRNEEHRHRMELMYGRVNKMPLLFERQSQYKCYPVTRDQLINKLQDDYSTSKYCGRYSNSSSLSSTEDLSLKPINVKREEESLKETIQSAENEKDKCVTP